MLYIIAPYFLTATAFGPKPDYMTHTSYLTFSETMTTHLLNISITDDLLLEFDETLQSMISLVTVEDGVTLNPDQANITIVDDDRK